MRFKWDTEGALHGESDRGMINAVIPHERGGAL